MRRLPSRHRFIFSLAIACIGVTALNNEIAFGQDDTGGPIVIGQQRRMPFTMLSDIHAAADFKYYFESDKSKSHTGQDNQSFTENRFEETFTLDARSYLYHPNLVDLSLAGTFGLSQEYDNNDGKTESNIGTIYDHDIEATILRKEVAPLTLYSRRDHEVIQREFSPSLDTTNSQYGAIWDIRSKSIPTRIEAYHEEQDQTGLGGSDNFNLKQNVLLWHSNAQPTKNQAVDVDYTLTDSHQTSGEVSSSFLTNELNLTHSLSFGRGYKGSLTSTLTYFDQSGDINLERLRIDELMRIDHTENFQTFYEYTLDQQSYENIDQALNRGRFGFIHKLYKSLITTGTVGLYQIDQSEGANTFDYFGNLNFDYTKRIPLGVLRSGLGFGYDHQEIQAHGTTTVLDSVGTFTDPQPIVIPAPNVIPGSIVVTDPSGLVLFTPGIDYTVRQLSNFTQIDRVIGGRILNGDTVLVDYQLSPEPASTSDTTTFTISVRYDILQSYLRGLSVYGSYQQQDQSLNTSETSTLVPNSFTDIIFGAEYRIWELEFGAEQEYHDSTISPFDATRFYGKWTHPISRKSNFNVIGNYNIIDYRDPQSPDHDELLTISSTINNQFTYELSGYLTVLYRNETDDLRGGTDGLEEQAELRWTHRQTTMYIRGRNSQLNTRDQDQTFQYLEIGVHRNF